LKQETRKKKGKKGAKVIVNLIVLFEIAD